MVTGCGSSGSGTTAKESAATTAGDTTAAGDTSAAGDTATEAAKSGEVTTIRFYGSDSEYNQNIVAGFQSENPDIKVEIVPVDFDNAEQIIKTGIASGDPVDVSFFWGSQINAFTDDNMAYDITPYLTENNNEWKDTDVYKRQGRDSLMLEFSGCDDIRTFAANEQIVPLLEHTEMKEREMILHGTDMNRIQHRVIAVLAETKICPLKMELMEPTLENLFLEVVK